MNKKEFEKYKNKEPVKGSTKRKNKKPEDKGTIASRLDDKWRDYLLAKHDYKCRICDKEATTVHHFIFKSDCKKLRFNEKNLIPACPSCHSKFHRFKGRFVQSLTNVLIKKLGIDWYNYLIEKKRESKEHSFWTKKYLYEQEKIIDNKVNNYYEK